MVLKDLLKDLGVQAGLYVLAGGIMAFAMTEGFGMFSHIIDRGFTQSSVEIVSDSIQANGEVRYIERTRSEIADSVINEDGSIKYSGNIYHCIKPGMLWWRAEPYGSTSRGGDYWCALRPGSFVLAPMKWD